MATLIGATIGRLRFNHAPLAFKQQTEVESASSFAASVGATISRLGLGQPPLLFEQSAEVRGGGAMATLIGAAIGRLRFNHAPLAFKQRTEVESASGVGRLRAIVRLPPGEPAIHAIANASRTGSGVMPVGVNLCVVGSGEAAFVVIARCEACRFERSRFHMAALPGCVSGLSVPRRGPGPEDGDQ